MANPGQNFNQTMVVATSPEQVSYALMAGTAGVPGYSVTTAGPGSIVLTRKFIPVWAIAVAIAGFLFFLIGLLALLYKETEVMSITLAPEGAGTRVTMSGVASQEMLSRLGACLNQMSPMVTNGQDQVVAPAITPPVGYAPQPAGYAAQPPAYAPQPVEYAQQPVQYGPQPVEYAAGTKSCPSCAHQVNPDSSFCDHCGYSLAAAAVGVPTRADAPAQ
jgi:hypothetical protein